MVLKKIGFCGVDDFLGEEYFLKRFEFK